MADTQYQTMPGHGSSADGSVSGSGSQGQGQSGPPHEDSREQDRLLPIANISRIIKKVLPEHTKLSKEAKSALQECVSEFIGFITSEASDRLMDEKRKTITGDDIIETMRALGFDSYLELLQTYLKRYRQANKVHKAGAAAAAAAAHAAASNSQTAQPAENTTSPQSNPSLTPPTKGAQKRGRKARGADASDEETPSTSPALSYIDPSAIQPVPTSAPLPSSAAAMYTQHSYSQHAALPTQMQGQTSASQISFSSNQTPERDKSGGGSGNAAKRRKT